MMTATMLVILMTVPGLALFYGGLVRSKNMLSVLMQVMVVFSLISVLWAVYGYSLAFHRRRGPDHRRLDKLFLKGVTPESLADTFSNVKLPELLFVAFQATFAGITCALIVGSFAERIKFSAVLLFSVLWFTFSYLPIAHMVLGTPAATCCGPRARSTSPAARWCTSTPASPAWWAPTCWASVSATARNRWRRTA
jgi:ammonium transporter, Amt family